jgi:hypothetical protein
MALFSRRAGIKGLAATRNAIRISDLDRARGLVGLVRRVVEYAMKTAVVLALCFISATALAQDAAAPPTQPPKIGGKPIVQVRPSAPAGCKFVGTVRGTKLWAGDCASADQLRTTTTADEPSSGVPLADRAAAAIPKGPQ